MSFNKEFWLRKILDIPKFNSSGFYMTKSDDGSETKIFTSSKSLNSLFYIIVKKRYILKVALSLADKTYTILSA